MKSGRLLVAAIGFAGAIILAALLIAAPYLERAEAARWTRSISVPIHEGGYRTLKPMVVRSEEHWQKFLANLKSTELIFSLYKEDNNWCRWLEFEDAIRNAKIDYPNEVLVLVPIEHGSSMPIEPMPLRLASKRLRFDVHLYIPGVNETAAVCKCFAFAVKADKVEQFEIRFHETTKIIDLK